MKHSFALICGIVMMAAGCGGPAKLPAGGTISYNGSPVADANVVFTPVAGGAEGAQGKLATGKTDAQGKFTLGTDAPNDGAVAGDYTVSVVKAAPLPPEGDYTMTTAKPPFPQKYSDATVSDLKATVKADGGNDFKLELKD